jgi:hypothetical protein
MYSRLLATTASAVISALFDVHLVKRCFSAALSPYRRGEAWRRTGNCGPGVLE